MIMSNINESTDDIKTTRGCVGEREREKMKEVERCRQVRHIFLSRETADKKYTQACSW
jgi:hypothetical protein